MIAKEKNRFPLIFTIGFSFFFLFLYWPGMLGIQSNGIFSHADDLWADKLFAWRSGSVAAGDPRIIIAAADDDTVGKYSFPLPREVYVKLLDKLKEYGVKTVAFDVLFFESQKVDKELIAATKRFKKVIHLFTTATRQTPHGEVIETTPPIEGLKEAAENLGYPNIDLVIDDDGHVRRSMMFNHKAFNPKFPDQIAPSMDIATVASFLDKPITEFYADYAEPEPATLLINFRRPTSWLLRAWRDEPKKAQGVANLAEYESPYLRLSILDILSGELTPRQKQALKGALVLVGSTTLGYFDHYPNPFSSTAPGVEYHANNIDNLLHDDFLRPVPRGFMLLLILLMIVVPYVLLAFPPAAGYLATAATLAGWFAFSYWKFGDGVRVEFVPPAAALVISFLVLIGHRVLTEAHEKRRIQGQFSQFVAPEVVADLVKNPEKAKLGGEKRDMTMFFLDIAHFTTISEKMPPEALILFLNKYLSALSQVVQDQKAVVGNYIGDCIMAFWNAPVLPADDHRARACLAAIECQERVAELNKDIDPSMPERPAVRIGVNSGFVTVGMTGSEKKLQYTVLGDEVNLASRLEGANKFFGSKIMASEDTIEGARAAVESRELGRVRVVGKAEPIKVFELLAKKGRLSPEWQKALPSYEKGVAHFNARKFPEAKEAFEQVLKIFPKDGPSSVYLTITTDYSAIPPPEDWDGVFNLTAK